MDAFMFSYIVTSVLDIPWTCSSSTAFVPKSLHVCLLNSTYLKCESLGFASAQGFREKRYKNWFPFKSKDIHQTSLSSLHFTAIFPLPSSFEADAQSSEFPVSQWCMEFLHCYFYLYTEQVCWEGRFCSQAAQVIPEHCYRYIQFCISCSHTFSQASRLCCQQEHKPFIWLTSLQILAQ